MELRVIIIFYSFRRCYKNKTILVSLNIISVLLTLLVLTFSINILFLDSGTISTYAIKDFSSNNQNLSFGDYHNRPSSNYFNSNDANIVSKNSSYSKLTHIDPVLGYRVDYPVNWFRNASTGYVYFEISNKANLKIYQYFGQPKLTLSTLSGDFYKYYINQGWNLSNANQVFINSKVGYFLKFEDPKTNNILVFYLFIHNSLPIVIEINIYGDLELEIISKIQDLLNSIQFQEQNNQHLPINAIKTGNTPTSFQLDFDNNLAYISNYHSNTLSILDLDHNNVLSNITVGVRPNDVAISPYDNQIYVANIGSNTVSVVDPITKTVIDDIKTGDMPTHVAIDSDISDRVIFVANSNSSSITPIAGETLNTLEEIKLQFNPWALFVNPFIDKLYVTSKYNGSDTGFLSIIDYLYLQNELKSNVTTAPLGCTPGGISVNVNTNKVYVTCLLQNSIIVIDGITNQILGRIFTNQFPQAIEINPDTHQIIIAHIRSNLVTVLDEENGTIFETTIPMDDYSNLNYISIDPRHNIAYVVRSYSNSIVPFNMSNGNLLSGVSFDITNSNSSDIECWEKDKSNKLLQNKKKYSSGDFLMVNKGTVLMCGVGEENKDKSIDRWYSTPFSYTSENSTYATFNITSFGRISVSFSDEQTDPFETMSKTINENLRDIFYSFVVAAIIGPVLGWALAYVVANREKKRQLKYIKTFIPLIEDLFKENLHNKEKCIEVLEQQRKEIIALLQNGLLNDTTFRFLNARIIEYIRKSNNMKK